MNHYQMDYERISDNRGQEELTVMSAVGFLCCGALTLGELGLSDV